MSKFNSIVEEIQLNYRGNSTLTVEEIQLKVEFKKSISIFIFDFSSKIRKSDFISRGSIFENT